MATALVMLTDPGNPEANGRMVHLLSTAAGLREAGKEVAIYFHGASVNWASAFLARQDKFTEHYGPLFDDVKPLIAGACNFCANVRFDQSAALADMGIAILGEDGGHHTIADIVLAGDDPVTF
jgi:hypothetical protein